MKRRHILSLSAMTALGTALLPGAAFAQSANSVVGTWTLVSATTELGGNKSDTFGPGAKGMLSLDAGGRYVLTILGSGLPKFASNNRATGTAEENMAVIGKSIAHFGTYSVNEADKTITFKIESATFPNWNETAQKRSFTISGDELKYNVAAGSAGGTAALIWKRAK